jgi:hypothetical protein
MHMLGRCPNVKCGLWTVDCISFSLIVCYKRNNMPEVSAAIVGGVELSRQGYKCF